MTSKRIYGKALILTIDGVDHAADVIEATVSFEDADTDGLTFGDVMNVGDQGKMAITAIQSTATASFWRTVWDNAGEKGIPFRLAPHGNLTATADEPHFTGTVDIGPRPAIGGAADPKKSYTFEVEWLCDVNKELVTTGTATGA